MSVRFAVEADIPAMLEIYAPYVKNTAVSFEYEVPSPEEFTRRFQTVTARFPWLVWEQEGKVLGYCYACYPFERAAFGWCAEPSVYLAPQAHRQGIGRQLYWVLEEMLKLLGYTRLYALVTADNAPSVAFHKALGYREIACLPDCGYKLGQWHGLTWLEKEIKSVKNPMDFPNPVQVIVNNDKIFRNILDNLPLSQWTKI